MGSGERKYIKGQQLFLNVSLPFFKGVYFKTKQFASLGSKLYTFREDPISEGVWCDGNQTGSRKKLSVLQNGVSCSIMWLSLRKHVYSNIYITKTCLYNLDPLKPHFYVVKLEFTEVYIIFLISA